MEAELISSIYNSHPVLEFCDRFNGLSGQDNKLISRRVHDTIIQNQEAEFLDKLKRPTE